MRVRENLFLIGLSSLPNDIERNTDILLRKNWFDVTLKFGSGLRGVIAFEKGGAGAQCAPERLQSVALRSGRA